MYLLVQHYIKKKEIRHFFFFLFLFFPFFFSFSTTADSTCGHPTDNQIKPNTCVVPSNPPTAIDVTVW